MIQFLLTYSSLIGLIAVVYCVVLTEPGEIFSGLYKFLNKILMARQLHINTHYKGQDDGKAIYVKKYIFKKISYRKKLRDYEWLFNPIIGCEKCVSGQMALWFYIVISVLDKNYYFFEHISLICLTIYFAIIFKTLYLWNKQYQEKN